MELSNIIFTDSFPKVDLHGFDRDMARVAINDFIDDNIKMGNEIILIIHGIGEGIIRNEVVKVLSTNKKVIDFKSVNNNRGCTVVKIRIDKIK